MNREKIIGAILTESTPVDQNVTILKNTPDAVTFEAVLQDFVDNRNKRGYKKQIINNGLKAEHIVEMITKNAWYGECGHPQDPDIKRQMYIDRKNASHRIKSYKMNDENVSGIIQTAMYPMGIALRDEIRLGHQAAFSMRGVGPVKQLPNGKIEVLDNLKIMTYDNVTFPSHKVAYQTKIISEQTTLIESTNSSYNMIPISEASYLAFLAEASEEMKQVGDVFGVDIQNSESTKLYLLPFLSKVLIEAVDPEFGRSKIMLNINRNLESNKSMFEFFESLKGAK